MEKDCKNCSHKPTCIVFKAANDSVYTFRDDYDEYLDGFGGNIANRIAVFCKMFLSTPIHVDEGGTSPDALFDTENSNTGKED